MEHNPLFSQQQTPVHNARKVYISILIVLILVLGTVYVVKTFGTPNYRKIKENLAGKIDQTRQVDPQQKQDLIDKVNSENSRNSTSSEDIQLRKQQLINQTQ